MGYDNSTFERTKRPAKRAKPPGDFEASKDAQRIRERKEPTFQRTDKRQQWQGVEF
jgi:hypothetical protein